MARHESTKIPREALFLAVTMHPPFAGDPAWQRTAAGITSVNIRMKPSRTVRFVSRGGKRACSPTRDGESAAGTGVRRDRTDIVGAVHGARTARRRPDTRMLLSR